MKHTSFILIETASKINKTKWRKAGKEAKHLVALSHYIHVFQARDYVLYDDFIL